MTEELVDQFKVKAQLQTIEEDCAYFVLENAGEEVTFKWPANKLPQGIQIGDTVQFSLEFEMAGERKQQFQKKAADEEKYKEMRKLLEDLVN